MKFDKKSMGFKLWLYFFIFAAFILSALWLLQTVFLQSFYESMKTKNIEQVGDKLSAAYGQADFKTTVDKAAFANSIIVYVTDLQGNILYLSDEHGPGDRKADEFIKNGLRDDLFFRQLPSDYFSFLTKLQQSENGRISYTVEQKNFHGESLVCGVLLQDAVLYISTPLEALNATTGILRMQLVYVTVASLLLSLVIAFFISRKFSRPVTAITAQARELAKGSFPAEFDKGFCSELDELAETLDYTSAELSKVETLRRELIANISHDLRTPLTMIKAYTEMIQDISGDNKEKREKHLSVIAEETDRLTNLVNDILAFSSIQAGNETLKVDNVNISETVKKILSRFEAIFAFEGYQFKISVESDQYVYADEQKIEQVLYNLIGNALNYIGEDKVILVNVKNLNSWVRVEVGDHGSGIPEDDIPFIWDRYYKSTATGERGKAGTGLGLSIVKGILEMHGARFGVDSQVGEGSTFWFELQK